jgi:type I restriction enzyme S subunit
MIADYPLPWPLVPLSAVAHLIRGVSFSGAEAHDSPRPNHLPVLRAGNISDRLIIETDLVWVPESRVSPEQRLRAGDVAICMSSGSAAVVGKTAALEQDWDGSVGAFCAIIRPAGYIDPRYLAAYLKASQFTQWRKNQAQGANIQNLRGSELILVPIPLPPLSEQQRIVEILQEAEEIRRLRAEAEVKTAELIPAMFRGLFGEIGSNSSDWPLVPVSKFVESFQGGKSVTGIEGDFDSSRPRVLKISAVTSGFLVPSESKALPSTYEPPDEHFVRAGDLLITRANTEELVGATALVGKECPPNLVLPDKIWRFVWKEGFEGTPEFVWALFQEQGTRRALGNIASGTGGSMKNISMKKLMQMRVAWPPKELQQRFSEALREVLQLCDSSSGEKVAQSLQASLSAYAFSGQLTDDWRFAHQDTLALEARERDTALKEASASVSPSRRDTIQEMESLLDLPVEGIYAELNRDQRHLLREIDRMVAGVRYARYFSAKQLGEYLADGPLRRNPQLIEDHLAVLAARGLIISVSREEQTQDTGEFVFGNTYRLPMKGYEPMEAEERGAVVDDASRVRELERLAAQLEKERMLT